MAVRITHDPEADAVYVVLRDVTVRIPKNSTPIASSTTGLMVSRAASSCST